MGVQHLAAGVHACLVACPTWRARWVVGGAGGWDRLSHTCHSACVAVTVVALRVSTLVVDAWSSCLSRALSPPGLPYGRAAASPFFSSLCLGATRLPTAPSSAVWCLACCGYRPLPRNGALWEGAVRSWERLCFSLCPFWPVPVGPLGFVSLLRSRMCVLVRQLTHFLPLCIFVVYARGPPVASVFLPRPLFSRAGSVPPACGDVHGAHRLPHG